jgi:hypothetical protein
MGLESSVILHHVFTCDQCEDEATFVETFSLESFNSRPGGGVQSLPDGWRHATFTAARLYPYPIVCSKACDKAYMDAEFEKMP